ncbi:phage head-tail joining protein [Pararhodospirillum oryzae]|uniref:Uncharacterized protein n=1 Tax=Pararhodospirillum oryzae TaxID=478448 RepID=A0A512H6A4_9PROT|nr:hypothetical protein [Pararhodospirillum oryzae]GEO80964.1 hypothetical protein ROR02_10950 [Pararhodospirillum oryzae]
MTTEDLVARRDALQEAIDTGVRECQYADGTRMVYRSTAEMRDALARLNERIGSSVPRVSRIVFSATKGL